MTYQLYLRLNHMNHKLDGYGSKGIIIRGKILNVPRASKS